MQEYVAREAGVALEPAQIRALTALAAETHLTIGDLARACEVDHSTMSRTVSRLAQMQLVERGTHSADGRIVVLQLSELGWTGYRRIQDATAYVLNSVFDRWSDDDTRSFAAGLERYAEDIRRFADDHFEAASSEAPRARAPQVS